MYGEAMNTHTAVAKSAKTLTWVSPAGQLVRSSNRRNYGVTDGQGNWMTFDGEMPYLVGTRGAAVEVAETVAPADIQWMAVASS